MNAEIYTSEAECSPDPAAHDASRHTGLRAVLDSDMVWGALLGGLAAFAALQALFVAYGFENARYLDEMAICGLAAFSVMSATGRRGLWMALRTPPGALLLAWFFWAVFSALVNGVSPTVAGAGIFVTIEYAFVFLLALGRPLSDRALRLVLLSVVTVGIAATLVGVAQRAWGPGLVDPAWQTEIVEAHIVRSPGLFRHPNDFGYNMVAATAIGVALVDVFRTRGSFMAVGTAFGGLMIAISRTASVAFLFWFGAIAILRRRLLKLWALALGIAVTVMWPYFVGGLYSRYEKTVSEGGDARLTILRKSIPLLQEHWFVGVGPGRFGGEVARRYGTPVYAEYGIDLSSTWKTIDDFWLHVFAETGLVGGTLFAAALVWIMVFALRRTGAATLHSPWTRTAALATAIIVGVYGLVGWFSNCLESNVQAASLWIIAGVALARIRAEMTQADVARTSS